MANLSKRDSILRLLGDINLVVEKLKPLILNLFEPASLIYFLSRVVLHH